MIKNKLAKTTLAAVLMAAGVGAVSVVASADEVNVPDTNIISDTETDNTSETVSTNNDPSLDETDPSKEGEVVAHDDENNPPVEGSDEDNNTNSNDTSGSTETGGVGDSETTNPSTGSEIGEGDDLENPNNEDTEKAKSELRALIELVKDTYCTPDGAVVDTVVDNEIVEALNNALTEAEEGLNNDDVDIAKLLNDLTKAKDDYKNALENNAKTYAREIKEKYYVDGEVNTKIITNANIAEFITNQIQQYEDYVKETELKVAEVIALTEDLIKAKELAEANIEINALIDKAEKLNINVDDAKSVINSTKPDIDAIKEKIDSLTKEIKEAELSEGANISKLKSELAVIIGKALSDYGSVNEQGKQEINPEKVFDNTVAEKLKEAIASARKVHDESDNADELNKAIEDLTAVVDEAEKAVEKHKIEEIKTSIRAKLEEIEKSEYLSDDKLYKQHLKDNDFGLVDAIENAEKAVENDTISLTDIENISTTLNTAFDNAAKHIEENIESGIYPGDDEIKGDDFENKDVTSRLEAYLDIAHHNRDYILTWEVTENNDLVLTFDSRFTAYEELSGDYDTTGPNIQEALRVALVNAYRDWYKYTTGHSDEAITEETLEQHITSIKNALEAADAYIGKYEKYVADKEATLLKEPLKELIDKIDVLENEVFPSVWEALEKAKEEAQKVIDADVDEIPSKSEVETIKTNLEQAIENANANKEVKRNADIARDGLKALIKEVEDKHYNENNVNSVLWGNLQNALKNAEEVLKNPEARDYELIEAKAQIENYYNQVDYVVSGTISISDKYQDGTNDIAISGLGGLKPTDALEAHYSEKDNNHALHVELAIRRANTDVDGENYYVSPNCDDGTIKITLPLVGEFDNLGKLYIYRITKNGDSDVYTLIDESKIRIDLESHTYTIELNNKDDYKDFTEDKTNTARRNFVEIAISRVALKEDGSIDNSTQVEIKGDIKDGDVAISSKNIDFSDATLTASVQFRDSNRMEIEISLVDKDGNAIDLSEGVSVQAGLKGKTLLDSGSDVFVYGVVNGVYSEINSTRGYNTVYFTTDKQGIFVISAVKLNHNGEAVDDEVDAEDYIVDLTKEDNNTLNKNQVNDLVSINNEKDVIIKPNQDIEFIFDKGTMSEFKADYIDFSVETWNSFDGSNGFVNEDYTLPKGLTSDNFAFAIDYKHSGELPGVAEIKINVGLEYKNSTLYYYQLMNDGSLVMVGNFTVNIEGYITVIQDHCSTYILTTEQIVTSNSKPDDGTSGDVSEDYRNVTFTKDDGLSITVNTNALVDSHLNYSATNIEEDNSYTAIRFNNIVLENDNIEIKPSGKATIRLYFNDISEYKAFADKQLYIYQDVGDNLVKLNYSLNENGIIFIVDDISKSFVVSTKAITGAIDTPPADTGKLYLENGVVSVDGAFVKGTKLTTTVKERNDISYGVTINLKDSDNNPITDVTSAKATIRVNTDKFVNDKTLHLYYIDNGEYKPVSFNRDNNRLEFTLLGNGEYVVSMVELDEIGGYADVSAVQELKYSLDAYCKSLKYNANNYNKVLWNKYDAAYQNAMKVINDSNATQEDLVKAERELRAVVDEMNAADSVVTAKKKLQDLIDDYKNVITARQYNQTLADKVNSAIKNAESVIADRSASIEKVNRAYDNLNSAIKEAETVYNNAVNDLETLLEAKVNLNGKSDYIVDKYNSARKNAQKVLDKVNPTLSEINNAKNTLIEAIGAVEGLYTVDTAKADIEKLLSQKYIEANYTPESWKVYIAARDKAKRVYDDDNATLEEADTAKIAFMKAINGLVKVGQIPNHGKNPPTGVVENPTTEYVMIISGVLVLAALFFKKRKIQV